MLRDILDNFTNATATRATNATSAIKNENGVARIARVQVATPEKKGISISNEIVSNWWLIHYVDCEPVEVAIWPPCSQDEALALNPQAVAAEPISSPVSDDVARNANE